MGEGGCKLLSVTREVQLRSGLLIQSTLSFSFWEVGDSAGEVPSLRAQNLLVTASCPPDAWDTTALGWAFPNNLPMDTMLAGLLGRHKRANEVQKS